MIELICIGTLITIVIIISDRQKSKKYRKKHKTPKQKGIEGENVISNIIQYAPMYKKIVRNAYIDMNENKKTEIDIIAISTKEEVDRIYNILQKYTQITEEEKIRQIMQNQNKI